jgi:autotransporter-associated beta strand protein
MKRTFTLLFAAFICFVHAGATDNRTWKGQAANNSWDLVTSNWTNPQSPLPLPTPFISGSNALFDDTAVRDTVSLVGAIEAGDVQFNNTTKNYVLKSSGSDAKLTGAGSLIKEGSGSLTLSVVNELTGGTVVKEGTVIQSSPTDISALGDSITLEGGIVRLGEKVNSDGSKYTFNKLVYIPAGRSGELFFNRYVNWENTSLSGDGELTIVVPGERVMFKKTVDISGYTNRNIIIEGSTAYDVPDKLFVIETDSTYNYETDTGKEEKFKYKTIQLRSGAGLATESSQTRRYVIGEITADDESCALYGYYKSSTSPVIEYEIGGLNTDVVFKGVIRTITISNGLPRTDNALGIIKVGTGTYKLTNGENFIGKGIDVKEGRIFISNPPDTRSGTGYARNRDAVIVYENGALGGTGRISGDVTVKGKLEPGEDGVGSLLIDDLKTVYDTLTVSTPKRYKLTFESTATAEMELATASGHDAVDVYEVAFGGKLAVKLASTYDLNAGDEFQLFKANNISGTFDAIELPNADTWTWDTSSLYADGKIKLTAGGGSGTDINQALINEIKLYPNPSSGSFEINAQGNIITGIQVFNPAGMTVYSDRPHSAQTVVNLTGAAKGIYIVKILSENQAIVRKVVIK